MLQESMQKCVNSTDIQKYIHHFGAKIHRVYPRLLDVEDAKNELWVAVFRAIHERYTPEKLLIPFAKRAIFSQYGSFIKSRGNAARTMNESTVLDIELGGTDPSYSIVNASFTLEQIKNDLKERASSSRQYRYAVQVFGLLRQGSTIKECCQHLHISKRYGYKIFHEIIRECGEKYNKESITIR